MEPFFGKQYKAANQGDNIDEYMKMIGLGMIARNMAKTISPVTELSKNDDGSYTLKSINPVRSTGITFKLGEEFEDERADGTKVKTVVTFEGNKLIQVQTDPKTGKRHTLARTFTPDVMTLVTTVEGWDKKVERRYELVK